MLDKAELLDHLLAPVTEHLFPRLKSALSACADRHQVADGQGADNFSFYTDAWSLPARQFRDAVEDEAIPFTMERVSGCVLALGNCRVRHHCVGVSENDDISRSFPRNPVALAATFEGEPSHAVQLSFQDFDLETPEGDSVLAFMASPKQGLCAVYLCRVGRVENHRIVEWAEWREVWILGSPDTPAKESLPLVEPEKIAAPVVRRTAKKTAENG